MQMCQNFSKKPDFYSKISSLISFAIKILCLFLLVLGVFKLPRHYLRWTGGFKTICCHTPLINRQEWEGDLPSAEVKKILSQSFCFLQRGTQSYAFISEDKQYILKIFAIPLKKHLFPRKLYPYTPALSQALYQKQMEEGIEGYKLAAKMSVHATGLIYLHLNTTKNLLPLVILRDAFHRKYILPLDSYRFVLQKKCELLAPCLQKMLKNQSEEAKKLIKSYHDAIAYRASFAIRNTDTEFKKNFGVLNGRVVEFDCGAYTYDSRLLDPKEQQKEVDLFQDRIRYWVKKHSLTRFSFEN